MCVLTQHVGNKTSVLFCKPAIKSTGKNSNSAYELLGFLLSVFRRKEDVWGVGLVEGLCMDQRLVLGEIWNQYASDNLKKTLQQSLRPYLKSIPHPTTPFSNRMRISPSCFF